MAQKNWLLLVTLMFLGALLGAACTPRPATPVEPLSQTRPVVAPAGAAPTDALVAGEPRAVAFVLDTVMEGGFFSEGWEVRSMAS
jgi:hypothetical protein